MPGNGHTKKGKPVFNAGEWTYEEGKRRLLDGTMNAKSARLKTREQNEEKTVRRCP